MKKTTIIPFLISLGGVVTDFATTRIGLSLGFYETHPQYHPFTALIIFWGLIAAITLAAPKKNGVNPYALLISAYSYRGMVNNTLVILGLFPGLTP